MSVGARADRTEAVATVGVTSKKAVDAGVLVVVTGAGSVPAPGIGLEDVDRRPGNRPPAGVHDGARNRERRAGLVGRDNGELRSGLVIEHQLAEGSLFPDCGVARVEEGLCGVDRAVLEVAAHGLDGHTGRGVTGLVRAGPGEAAAGPEKRQGEKQTVAPPKCRIHGYMPSGSVSS